jgi:formylglycine-generating enzyme required for sulfatase activity
MSASGPLAGGSADDINALGLRNMGGNLSEWVADDFAAYGDPTCWGPDVSLHDNPQCQGSSALGVLRGGSWISIPYESHTYFRASAPPNQEAESVGIRCAKDAQ